MEVVEEIVIVGAGIAGLSTSLGLHRLGIPSLVLESSESLRVAGFALSTWPNAWKALDALGVGDSLRQLHYKHQGVVFRSMGSGQPANELRFHGAQGYEVRCVQRRLLLEALAKELPAGTVRLSSKVVSIEDSGCFKLVHLADGTILKTKVLVGCDGVNSVVAKMLGFKKSASTGRSAIRGLACFQTGHGFEPKFLQFFGNGTRSGFIPCDDKTIYWFLTHNSNEQDEAEQENPVKLKQFVLNKVRDLPDHVKNVVEMTGLDNILSSPLRYRPPWQILFANINKSNVCVAGDALHPMTPDIGQGGCSALEDGVVLARCLGEAMLTKKPNGKAVDEEEECKRIKAGLRKYSQERRWRSIDLITTAYIVGFIQQSSGKMMSLLRDRVLSSWLARLLLKKSSFDCGKLVNVS